MLKRALLTVAAGLFAALVFAPSKGSATVLAGPVVSLSKSVVTPPELVRRRYYRRYYRRHYYWRPRYRYRRYYWRPRYRYRRRYYYPRRHYYRRYYGPGIYFRF